MSASGPEVFGQPLSAKPTYNVRHDPGSRHPARLFRLKHNHPAPPRDGIWIKCSMVFSGGVEGIAQIGGAMPANGRRIPGIYSPLIQIYSPLVQLL